MGAFAASASMARRDYSYRKDLSPQSWRYFLAKDATPALKLDSDKVLTEALESLGDEVSEYFRTCTKEQAKEIYKMLIKTMQDDDWSLTQIKKRIMNIVGDNDGFTEKDAERIANTEVERILCVAKERYYEDEKVVWVGPLDDRTTAMCRYAQTGKLSEKYEHLRKDLPEWKKEGFTVKQMKTFLHKIWQVFHDAGVVKTKMISDWSMHIGCRHTFQPIPPTGSGDGHLQDGSQAAVTLDIGSERCAELSETVCYKPVVVKLDSPGDTSSLAYHHVRSGIYADSREEVFGNVEMLGIRAVVRTLE
jgi:hypothetical protein